MNLLKKYNPIYPSLIKSLTEDKLALLNVLKLPYRHRKSIRSTNLIERAFEEEDQFLTEKSCLKLVFSILYRVALRWRRYLWKNTR